MTWLDKIERTDAGLEPVYLDESGKRFVGSMSGARGSLPSGWRVGGLEGYDLTRMRPVGGEEYLEFFGVRHSTERGHQVFELLDGDQRVLIPALVLLQAFTPRLYEFGSRLLNAVGIDGLAVAMTSRKAVQVRFTGRTGAHLDDQSEVLQTKLRWMTCFPSGRRFTASVHLNALDGRLCVESPKVAVDAALMGRRAKGTVFATRLTLKTVRPLEEPLPFASVLSGKSLNFAPYEEEHLLRAAKANQSFMLPGGKDSRVTQDTSIPRRSDSKVLTQWEWSECVYRMRAQGLMVNLPSMERVAAMLRKQSEGIRWRDTGEEWRSAADMHSLWVRNGKWDALLSILRELRA